VRLVFANALAYNTAADHPVRVAAEALASLFEERFEMFYKPYLQQLEEERVKKVGGWVVGGAGGGECMCAWGRWEFLCLCVCVVVRSRGGRFALCVTWLG
jgi:hypothetical protein